MQTVNAKQLREGIIDVLKADLVPFVESSPGCAKSAIVKAIAKEFNLFLIDLRLSTIEPMDIPGFPGTNATKTRSNYIPFDFMPLEGDPIPKGYAGFLLFLDEMNSAGKSLQAAAYQLILDKQAGQRKLHPKCKIVAAGNLMTDNAIVNSLSTAMQSRMIHFTLVVSQPAWIKWAVENEIDSRIISFLEFRKGLLHNFNPKHSDKTFPCPRTWEFLSKIIKPWKTVSAGKAAVIAGTVGEGAGVDFRNFCELYTKLPSIDQIMKDPVNTKVPEESGLNFALAGAISDILSYDNADTLMDFIIRMPVETQVICIRRAYAHKADIVSNAKVDRWLDINANRFVG